MNRRSDNGKITLDDLLDAESEVLNRIANEIRDGAVVPVTAGHTSHSMGHSSSGGHTSYSSARIEFPLADSFKPSKP